MTIYNKIKHTEKGKLNELFVGHKIVSVRTETDKYGEVTGIVTLDNGVKMVVFPNNGGCCGKGEYRFK